MSAKKDALVNIGGWLAVNDWEIFEELRNLVVVYEGLHTYGGLAGRDMEALARGIEESVQDDTSAPAWAGALPGRIAQDWNIPIVQPVGGHAIFLDAKAFYPHLEQINSRPKPWPPNSTSIRASARWSAASSPLGATRNRRPLLPQTRADPADHPAPRLHPGAHGRGGRSRQSRLRAARRRPAA
jgi:hypothetical protein